MLRDVAYRELDLENVLDVIARYCRSSRAGDVVRSLRPIDDVSHLRTTLRQVQEGVDILAAGVPIPMGGLDDVRPQLQKSRIAGNFLSAPDIMLVQEVLVASRILKTFFMDQQRIAPSLYDLTQSMVADRVLEKHITDAIDDTGAVRDTASRELQEIRREIHAVSARLRHRLARILKQYGEDELLQEDFITQRDGRFVLPLRVGNKRAVDGIIHGMSASGNTVFLEPAETYDMNNELSILRSREQREIIRILTVLTTELGAVSFEVEAAYEVMTTVDTILARAHYAIDYGGLQPTILDRATVPTLVELIDVRHPVLLHQARERRRMSGSASEVIPLTVSLDSNHRGMLISGPNAGGKTVAMKTIGLSVVMAMSGVFPLGTCTLAPKRVYTAIGDHQSIDSNLSTFSSQIIRLRDVLAECDSDALVLIDEICAGTDPAEGGALAAGILDSLVQRTALFVVTTHQSSLKQYALTQPTITNASLAFDTVHLQPTFTFLPGVPGNSYAFDLARSVGLPAVVIERGQSYLGDRHGELEQSIHALQQYLRDAEQLKADAARERQKAAELRTDLEQRLAEARKKKSTALQDARQEAQELLRSANALIENTIREVREQARSQREMKDIKQDFATARDQLLGDRSEQPTRDEPVVPIAVGDTVVVTGTASSGTVLAIDAKTDHATIDVNGIKFRVKRSQLQKTSHRSRASTSSQPQREYRRVDSPGVVGHVIADASTTLDLRGMRADECVRALEQFLDTALLRHLPFATIIHGKGTGALRKVVHDYLADYHGTTGYRMGKIEEGGDGVTIVEF